MSLESKEAKLKEMYATKAQLDAKMERLKEKEELDKIRKEKAEAARLKIQEDLKIKATNMDEEEKLKLAAAAEKINASKKKEKGFFDKLKDKAEDIKEAIEMFDRALQLNQSVGDPTIYFNKGNALLHLSQMPNITE